MEDVKEFLKKLDFSDIQRTIETLSKATVFYAYYVQEYAKAHIERRIKEAEAFLQTKNGEKKTVAEREAEALLSVENIYRNEKTLEAIIEALEQTMTTCRKILETSKKEEDYSQYI